MEDTTGKVCPNCGERLPSDSTFCVKCGTRIDGAVEGAEQSAKTSKSFKKKIVFGVIGVVAVVLILFIVNAVQASNLKKELKRDWYKVAGEGGTYILCVLDFSDDEIEYRLETGYKWMDTTVATYKYKVISKNKIKVLRYGEWETIIVDLHEDKTMMVVSPALTSVDNVEIWMNLD